MRRVVRDSIACTTGLAQATTVQATITEIGGVPLIEFDEIVMRFLFSVQTNSAGAGTLDTYIQRPVVGLTQPDGTVDADWDDYIALPQLAKQTARDVIVRMPLPGPQDVDGSLASWGRARAIATLTADTILHGDFGDALRVVEKIGGAALSVAGVYTIQLTGIRRS